MSDATSNDASRRILNNELTKGLVAPMFNGGTGLPNFYVNYLGSESIGKGVKVAIYGAKFQSNNRNGFTDVILLAIPESRKPNCNTVSLNDKNFTYDAFWLYRGALISKLQEQHPDLHFGKLAILPMLKSSSNEDMGIQMKLINANAKERIYKPQNGAFSEAFELVAKNGNSTTIVNSTSIPLGELLLNCDISVYL